MAGGEKNKTGQKGESGSDSDSADNDSSSKDQNQSGKGNGSQKNNSRPGEGQPSGNQPSSEGQSNAESSSQKGGKPDKQGGQAKVGVKAKTIVNAEALAKMLAQKMAGQMFKTKDGLKTGAELAQEIQSGKEKLDFESQDGSMTGKVRGQKAIAEGEPTQMQELNRDNQKRQDSDQYGSGEAGGAVVGKMDFNLPQLQTQLLTSELQSVLPIIRQMAPEQIQEVLQKWVQAEPGTRSRMGAEFRVIKGIAHLNAIKAVAEFQEVSDGQETLSNAGERIDFQTGHRLDMKLSPMRTVVRALAQGGIIDNRTEVREKRITTDAPHLFFLVDGSGSMGYQGRMQSALASVQAVGMYYGPRGSTFGAAAFTNDPVMLVTPPERDHEEVISKIMCLTPKWGTSYAKGLDMAIRAALPKSTLIVFGDFEDGSVISEEVRALKQQKELKVIGIISNEGDANYAASICDDTYIVDFADPTQAALVALQVSQ